MKTFVALCIFFVTVALVAAASEVLDIEASNLVNPSMSKVEEAIENAKTVMLAALDSLMETEVAARKEKERSCGQRYCTPEERARCGGRLTYPC